MIEMNGPDKRGKRFPGPDHADLFEEIEAMADAATIPESGQNASLGLCALCGQRQPYEKGYGVDYGLCSHCAEAVANSYSYTHAGKWLTYPNAPVAQSRPVMPQDLRWEVLRSAGFTCQACGAKDRPLHVDHIIALARGGSGERSNLQCLCDRCNTSKGAR